MSTKVSEIINSAKIEHGDLGGKEVTLTIESYAKPGVVEGSDGKKIDKVCLYFVGTPKYFVMNVTNLRRGRVMLGNDLDGWIAQKITLVPTTTEIPKSSAEKFGCMILKARGKMVEVPCIRVKIEMEDDEP